MKKGFFSLLLLSGSLLAAPPMWWSEPGTAILVPGKPSSPLSPAAQAQLMWTAKQAAKHLDQYLPGGAGPKIHALVESFSATNPNTRLRLVNLAQLKSIGKCYYDRLLEVGYPTKTNLLVHGYSNWAYSYPWNPSTPKPVNLRPCALAQIKAVFSFDLRDVSAPFDVDGLGIPDWWENYYYGGSGYSANSLTAGGVLTLGQAFQGNTNPTAESTAGDGVSDLWKLANGHSATDVVSSLVDGIPDAWLISYGIDPNMATAEMDTDQGMGDGLSLLDEFKAGTNPNVRDTDGDGGLDGEDGWALDAQLSPPRLGEVRYAVIDLAKDGLTAATALSDAGHVLGWKASGTPALWFQGAVTELPSQDTDSSPLNWSGINASGNAVGWKENDDNISIVPHCLYTYANSTFGTAMESYYEGLPAQNRASGFFVPITTNNGAIYAEAQQAGSSPPATHVGRSGILRVESGSAQELPDYWTLTTVNNPPGPDQLSQMPVNAISMTFPIDANDAGILIGYAKHYQLQANTIVESNLTSALIEAGAIHDLKDLPGSLPSGFNWAASVSEGPDSLVVGTSSGEFAIWAKRPQWKRIYFPNVGSKISGVPVSVNARAEMVGAGLQSALGDKGQLIRNGKVLNLSNLNATHVISSAQLINEAGQILAWGKPKNNPNANETPLLLIPVALMDTKDKVLDTLGTIVSEANRDVVIEPKKNDDDKNLRSIAWIEPHGSEDTVDAPDMPQLVLKFQGTEQVGLKIKWKLKVQYKRPNGRILNSNEDKVEIPDANGWITEALDGAVKIYDNTKWKNELQQKGFFGGDAELTFQLLKGDGSALGQETTWKFYIGGKNPDDTKTKTFITETATIVQQPMAWFVHAIAKHESKDYNGEGSRYNQFWENSGRYSKVDHHAGEVLWVNNQGEGPPKGFGLFQVTDNAKSEKADIPRKQLWNWQDNIKGGLAIIAPKRGVADRYFIRIQGRSVQHKAAYNENPPPQISIGSHMFSSADAIQIYCYNGTGKLNGNPAIIDVRYPFDPNKPPGLGPTKRWFWNPHNIAGGEPYINKVELELE